MTVGPRKAGVAWRRSDDREPRPAGMTVGRQCGERTHNWCCTSGVRSIRLPASLVLWLALGAASGAVMYFGDIPGFLLAAVPLIFAVALTASRRVLLALPVFLVGLGVTGTVLSGALSPASAFTIDTSGHSPVCSSTGCVGQTVVQSAFSVPSIAIYAVILLIGAVWLAFPIARSRFVHRIRG